MGMRITWPGKESMVIKPFSKTLPGRTVQLWCDVHANSCNLAFRKTITSKKTPADFVIEFSLAEFTAVSKPGGKTLHAFAQRLKTKTSLAYSPRPVVMDAAMHQCIYRITHSEESDETKTLHAYARVIELLALFQANYIKTNSAQPVYIKNEYDKERILYARDYLLTHMDAPPALSQLATIVGINEFKLKCGFKEMFGQPPFAYLADVRLEMARTALQKKEKTVTQIAFELGYASLQHFSAAFKKKFGVPPARFV